METGPVKKSGVWKQNLVCGGEGIGWRMRKSEKGIGG